MQLERIGSMVPYSDMIFGTLHKQAELGYACLLS